MSVARSSTHHTVRTLFEVSEVFLAQLLTDLRGNRIGVVTCLAAIDGAKIGVERDDLGTLNALELEFSDTEREFRTKASEFFREVGAFVPDAQYWGGAFVPAWLPSEFSDRLPAIAEGLRSLVSKCLPGDRPPFYAAFAETELSAARLIRLASDEQIIISPGLWGQFSGAQQRTANALAIHPPMLAEGRWDAIQHLLQPAGRSKRVARSNPRSGRAAAPEILPALSE